MVEEGTNVTVEVVLDVALAPGITVPAVVVLADGSALSKYQTLINELCSCREVVLFLDVNL